MVGISQRMTRMKAVKGTSTTTSGASPQTQYSPSGVATQIMGVRVGPGSVLLPKDVQRITLRFAVNIGNGHQGSKRFWRQVMPRLKFRNPAVQMVVDRSIENTESPIMTIHFAPPATASPSPAKDTIPTGSTSGQTATSNHQATERVVSVDVKGKNERGILQELLTLTQATELKPEQWELDEVKSLSEMADKSAKDRARQAELRAALKKEEHMLRIARGEIGLNPA